MTIVSLMSEHDVKFDQYMYLSTLLVHVTMANVFTLFVQKPYVKTAWVSDVAKSEHWASALFKTNYSADNMISLQPDSHLFTYMSSQTPICFMSGSYLKELSHCIHHLCNRFAKIIVLGIMDQCHTYFIWCTFTSSAIFDQKRRTPLSQPSENGRLLKTELVPH